MPPRRRPAAPELRLPYAEVNRRDETGVPYLRPDLVLLFKAKAVRPRDQDDFDRNRAGPQRRRAPAWRCGSPECTAWKHPWVTALQS